MNAKPTSTPGFQRGFLSLDIPCRSERDRTAPGRAVSVSAGLAAESRLLCPCFLPPGLNLRPSVNPDLPPRHHA